MVCSVNWWLHVGHRFGTNGASYALTTLMGICSMLLFWTMMSHCITWGKNTSQFNHLFGCINWWLCHPGFMDWVQVCVRVSAGVFMCLHVCAFACMCVHGCRCIHMCVHGVHVPACVCMCVHLCAYVCMVCMCLHVSACVFIHVHVFQSEIQPLPLDFMV